MKSLEVPFRQVCSVSRQYWVPIICKLVFRPSGWVMANCFVCGTVTYVTLDRNFTGESWWRYDAHYQGNGGLLAKQAEELEQFN